MNCFASGVFLSVCFLDLLPEVEEKMEEFIKSVDNLKNSTFPLTQFFIIIGFLVLLIIEQVIVLCFVNLGNLQIYFTAYYNFKLL